MKLLAGVADEPIETRCHAGFGPEVVLAGHAWRRGDRGGSRGLSARPRAGAQREKNPAICRAPRKWRDPDSYRGHDDFQSATVTTSIGRFAGPFLRLRRGGCPWFPAVSGGVGPRAPCHGPNGCPAKGVPIHPAARWHASALAVAPGSHRKARAMRVRIGLFLFVPTGVEGHSAPPCPPGRADDGDGLTLTHLAVDHHFLVPVLPDRVQLLRPLPQAVDARVPGLSLSGAKDGTKLHRRVEKLGERFELPRVERV